jgi:hypothetical protein
MAQYSLGGSSDGTELEKRLMLGTEHDQMHLLAPSEKYDLFRGIALEYDFAYVAMGSHRSGTSGRVAAERVPRILRSRLPAIRSIRLQVPTLQRTPLWRSLSLFP